MGCGAKSIGEKSASQVEVQGTQVSWCCSRGRLFLVWVALCGFDQHFCSEKREATKIGKTRINRPPSDTGVGYGGYGGVSGLMLSTPPFGMGPLSGYGYGPGGGYGRFGQSDAAIDANKQKAQNAQEISDNFTAMLLGLLAELLPSLDKQTTFDMSPPEAVTSMLLHSKILNKAAELLRNDSLEDATKRKHLYQALLNFLRTSGTHPLTAKRTMFSERALRPDTVNLITLSFGDHAGSKKCKEDTSSSLGDCLRNLYIQSNMMLRGAQLNQQEFHTQEGQDMLWLCRQVSDLSEYLLAETKAGSGGGKSHVEAITDRGIIDADDELIISNHSMGSVVRNVIQSPPGRMKRLITEITTLKTGLPPGIFVKYASSRLDFMKVLIVGPVGTPYENGLFEFDLLCNFNFPHESPRVQLRTTGNGTVSFNPNLYADGKGKGVPVCIPSGLFTND
jgi:hypothetical protein